MLKVYNDHIIFADRKHVEGIKVVVEIMKISQVSGNTRPEPSGEHEIWELASRFLLCPCPSCVVYPSCDMCIYKEEMNIRARIVE